MKHGMTRKERIDYFQNFDYATFINNPKVAAFIGKDYDYFKTLWAKDFEKKKGDALKVMTTMHWTWLGVVLGPVVWFSYRKMYKLAWVVIGLYAAVSFLETFFRFDLGSGGFLAANLILALMAKNYYFGHVVDFFRSRSDLSGAALENEIARHGGTNIWAPFVMFIAHIVLVMAASALGDIASGNPVSFMLTTESIHESTTIVPQ